MLWKTDEQPEDSKRVSTIPAPKMKLPGHAESYNPPPEYLMTDKEKERWDEHRYKITALKTTGVCKTVVCLEGKSIILRWEALFSSVPLNNSLVGPLKGFLS